MDIRLKDRTFPISRLRDNPRAQKIEIYIGYRVRGYKSYRPVYVTNLLKQDVATTLFRNILLPLSQCFLRLTSISLSYTLSRRSLLARSGAIRSTAGSLKLELPNSNVIKNS